MDVKRWNGRTTLIALCVVALLCCATPLAGWPQAAGGNAALAAPVEVTREPAVRRTVTPTPAAAQATALPTAWVTGMDTATPAPTQTASSAPQTASPSDTAGDTSPVLSPAGASPSPAPALAYSPAVLPAGLQIDALGYALAGEAATYDREKGEYHYWSQTLQVHIFRHADTDPRVVWFEAQIFSRDGTLFHVFAYDEADRVTKTAHQTVIAQKNHVVFAVNGDFAHLRLGWHATAGLLIRSGVVVSKRTFSRNATKYPNLDNLAFLPDGSMLAVERNKMTIDDFVALGAYDLLAFGPLLLHEGVANTKAFHHYGWERAPRTAIGMVEPGHYVAIMVEGRQEESRGWSTTHMAQHMAALGVVEALNLDGGQSATMIFMGEQIIRVGNSTNPAAKPRKAAEVVGIGQSELVQLPQPTATPKK